MASTAGTTYDVTIPHTSPMISYSGDWQIDCPTTNGTPICGDGQTVTGTHYSTSNGAKMRIKFWGPSIYIYGEADADMRLTLQVNGGVEKILEPGDGMLVAIDDITTPCDEPEPDSSSSTLILPSTLSCIDRSNLAPGSSSYAYNDVEITTTLNNGGAKVSFSKAVFPYATHSSGASVSLKIYTNSDPAIQYETGWTQNGTYMQAGGRSDMDLAFDGVAIWVWGLCPRTSYGWFRTNDNDVDMVHGSPSDSISSPTPMYAQDKKCLIYFQGGLYNTGNTLKYDPVFEEFQFDSIDVLQVTGGTFLATATDFPTATATVTSTPRFNSGRKNKRPSLSVAVALFAVFVIIGTI